MSGNVRTVNTQINLRRAQVDQGLGCSNEHYTVQEKIIVWESKGIDDRKVNEKVAQIVVARLKYPYLPVC